MATPAMIPQIDPNHVRSPGADHYQHRTTHARVSSCFEPTPRVNYSPVGETVRTFPGTPVFMPKRPATKLSGSKMVATDEKRFMTSLMRYVTTAVSIPTLIL